ncbi:hypothetical protein G7Y79_00110g101640 [Physcia stellaris]|nr:hypothetical protein G7Y79_00110g101640 [Physcia stellaris]
MHAFSLGNKPSEPSTLNESSIPGLFVSPPAAWFYGYGRGEPEIPTTKGPTKDPGVYVALDHDDDMVFPIHKACLQIIERLCQTRQLQAHASKTEKPASLLDFCDGLRKQRWSNCEVSNNPFNRDDYYARSGGLEWPHGYYGARQFWTDEWDEEPDGRPLAVQDMPTNKQLADRLGWLLPEELDTVMNTDLGCIDWDRLVDTLLRKASEESHKVGDEEERKEGRLKPTTAPVGLQNRWRIWKILEAI